MILQYLLII